MNCDFAKLSK